VTKVVPLHVCSCAILSFSRRRASSCTSPLFGFSLHFPHLSLPYSRVSSEAALPEEANPQIVGAAVSLHNYPVLTSANRNPWFLKPWIHVQEPNAPLTRAPTGDAPVQPLSSPVESSFGAECTRGWGLTGGGVRTRSADQICTAREWIRCEGYLWPAATIFELRQSSARVPWTAVTETEIG